MSDAVKIAATKKRAELNIWLEGEFAGMLTDKKIFLMGLAAGLHLEPEVDAQLTERGRAYIPDPAVGRAYIVKGIEVNGAFYEAWDIIDDAEARFDAAEISEEHALALIEEITPRL